MTMNPSVFEFTSYRKYLAEALPTSGKERGGRARLAEHLGCLSGFVSLVIGGGAHFSPEHAIRASTFLKHDEEEKEFFLLLLQQERAGSKDLENHYGKKIRAMLQKRREIRDRIKAKTTVSERDQATYYSSWLYSAVHLCLFIPHLKNKAAIASHLGVATNKVGEVLQFLREPGMAEANPDGTFRGKPIRAHLAADSPLIARHHVNWRMKAIQSLDAPKASVMHYSAAFSLSQTAAEKIRTVLLEAIQETEPLLKEAEDKTLYVMGIDWFEI